MKEFSKSYELKSSIAPKITYLITFLDNNRKSDFYTGGNIHGIYRYLDIIVAPTTLTTSCQLSHHFGPSYSIKNYTLSLQKLIASLHMRQKSICGCCGRIGQKADAWIIHGPKFLPQILRRMMNNFNALHGEETDKPLR